jgi:hypothetical protein
VRLGHDARGAPRHLQRRAAGEGEEQDPLRLHAFEHEVRDAVREGAGLAGAGAGDDEQRARGRLRGRALLRVQFRECLGRAHGAGL